MVLSIQTVHYAWVDLWDRIGRAECAPVGTSALGRINWWVPSVGLSNVRFVGCLQARSLSAPWCPWWVTVFGNALSNEIILLFLPCELKVLPRICVCHVVPWRSVRFGEVL